MAVCGTPLFRGGDLATKARTLQSAVPKSKNVAICLKPTAFARSQIPSCFIDDSADPGAHVRFCTFSDDSFARSRDRNSYQGILTVATDCRTLSNKQAVIAPLAWSGRKAARAARSTLSAEVVSLCNSVDRMFWLRLFWEWVKNPSLDISQPLKGAPQAALVTDCESAYDIATQTAISSCSDSVRMFAAERAPPSKVPDASDSFQGYVSGLSY